MEQFCTDTNTISADAYTLIATEHLSSAEEDEEIQQALRGGNQAKFIEIMKGILDNQLTWGDHIKRYIYECVCGGDKSRKLKWVSEDGVEFEDITEENIREFIKKAFKDNGMRNRGSMDPNVESTTLGSNLKKWLSSPVTGNTVTRNVCFLFCFGLNMNEQYASYLLEVLRQPDFNPKDYKEAIYYYCLCNNLQYAGVVEWLERYENLEPMEDYEENPGTMVLRDNLRMIKELSKGSKNEREEQFLQYLTVLKSMPANNQPSETRAKVLEEGCKKFYQSHSQESNRELDEDFKEFEKAPRAKTRKQISRSNALLYKVLFQEEDTNIKGFADILQGIWIPSVEIPSEIREMVKNGILQFPELSYNYFYERIKRITEVSREDILTIVFLYCSCNMQDDDKEDTYAERKADFVYEASICLDRCGFGDMYLLNPYELFLVSCLLQKKPMEYFLAVWKELG